MREGVSFVVPVHNGAAWIRDTLEAIVAQDDGRPMEIIVVDDRSADESAALLRQLSQRWPLRLLTGEGRGAAAAINEGVRAARFPIVCQVDQDVVIGPGWMRRLTMELEDPTVGAAQGYYATDRNAGLCARARRSRVETPATRARATRRIARTRCASWGFSTKRSATATTTTSAIACATPVIG